VRSQITRAILAVAVLLVIGLGLPLAVVVQRFYQDGAVADLQRRAAETIVEISLPLAPDGLSGVAAEADSPGEFTVYDAEGHHVFGPGPVEADAPVQRAINGQSSSVRTDAELVLASPITDRSSETIVGAVRVTQARAVVDRQVRRAWLVMAMAVAVALAGATTLARRQARHLAAPVAGLAAHAVDLGRGDFTARIDPSGIPEVDTVAAALNDTAARLAELLARERAFSADVSHQLRTPLTGLRLRLERATDSERPRDHLGGALEEIGRLESTVEHLLALSRDRHPVGAPLAVDDLLDDIAPRWRERFIATGRELRVEHGEHMTAVRGSDLSLSQVLDVLIDNSLHHGAGAVTVRSRAAAGGLVLEVEDEGPGVAEDRLAAVFNRHEGHGHGIGLALARSLTESEGGRLLLASGRPPRFQVILPAAD
jgi:signal transduction histidine kinase